MKKDTLCIGEQSLYVTADFLWETIQAITNQKTVKQYL